MQERGTRDEAFSADGGSGRSRTKIRSTKVVDGSAGIASYLFEDLAEWAK